MASVFVMRKDAESSVRMREDLGDSFDDALAMYAG